MSTHVHRSIDRRAALSKAAEMRKSALDNVGSEVAGTLLAPATGAIGGSAIGALAGGILAGIKGKDIARGAGAGAGLGALVGGPAGHLANFGGVLAGVLRKRRTREEQQKHDSKSHWGNFIPGVASYNYTKRIGRVLSGVGEPDKEKKAAEALSKQAGLKAKLGILLGKGVGAMRRGGARYGELLRGSSDTLAPYQLAQELTHGFGAVGRKLGVVRPGETTLAKLQLAVAALRGELGEPVATELAKVYATRAGTGAAGVGLSGLALHSALSGAEQKKAAEAAFAEGFCKAAEAAGVDPVALYKQAAPWGFLGGLAGRALGAARAARGAVQAKGLIGATRQGLSAAGGAIARGGQQAAGYGKRYLELLRGGNADVRGAFGMGRGDLASMGKLKGYAQTYAEGLRGGMGADAASELRKVLAARGATAAGVLGGAAALSGSSAAQDQGMPG